jgi:integrase
MPRTGKRPNGEGGIRKRPDGRWESTISVGWEDGKRQRRSFYGRTQQEVLAKLTAARRAQDVGLALPPERLTVAAYFEHWLEDSAKPRLQPSTYAVYAKDVRLHILPSLGRVRLARLEPAHLQKLYREKLEAGLAPASVRHIHNVMSGALSQAERWNLVPRNVARLAHPPRLPHAEAGAFDADQARRFLEAVEHDRLRALYVVTLTTGLRRGEVLALRWDDIDLDRGLLSVRRSLRKVPGGWDFGEPKTRSSRRVVKLPDIAVHALKAHRLNQLEERLAAPAWLDPTLVFATQVGTPLDGRNLLREFKCHLARAGLDAEAFSFKSLRHSAATLLLSLNVQPKVIMETLGHSRLAVTMEVYSHVLPHLQDEAAAKMDALLAPKDARGGHGGGQTG